MIDIVGSSANFMPKRPLWIRIKSCDPIWFIKTSFRYMRGYSKSYILIHMIPAYIRYVIATLKQ